MQIGSAHPQIAGDAENPRGAQSGGGAGDWCLTQPAGRSARRPLCPALPGCASPSAGEALCGSLVPDPSPASGSLLCLRIWACWDTWAGLG